MLSVNHRKHAFGSGYLVHDIDSASETMLNLSVLIPFYKTSSACLEIRNFRANSYCQHKCSKARNIIRRHRNTTALYTAFIQFAI